MKQLYSEISSCRSCDSRLLEDVFSLGEMALCGIFPAEADEDPPAAPLDLVLCPECGLLQLAHNFNLPDLFHAGYGYRSGINESMSAHLRDVAATALNYVTLHPGDRILDIGANDGTLLHHYGSLIPDQMPHRIALDPLVAQFDAYYRDSAIQRVPDFFSANAIGGGTCKLITSVAMFYDLPDPNSFVSDIRDVLHPDGVWVLELSYLPSMLDTTSFDTICHEHLEYYALGPIEALFARHGLAVVDVTVNQINGGSFQIVVTHQERLERERGLSRDPSSRGRLRHAEAEAGLETVVPYEALFERAKTVREDVHAFLSECKKQEQRVFGYGASTKGNTLLQFCDVTCSDIVAIADRNPLKEGRRTPKTAIPIISEAAARSREPDAFFCLPWHFRDSFLQRETDFLARGGRLVFPLPEFEVYTKDTR